PSFTNMRPSTMVVHTSWAEARHTSAFRGSLTGRRWEPPRSMATRSARRPGASRPISSRPTAAAASVVTAATSSPPGATAASPAPTRPAARAAPPPRRDLRYGPGGPDLLDDIEVITIGGDPRTDALGSESLPGGRAPATGEGARTTEYSGFGAR